jgi:hypothetical protein
MNTVTWNPDEKMRKKKKQTIGNNLNNDKTGKTHWKGSCAMHFRYPP